MPQELKNVKASLKKTGFFRFKKFSKDYLLTNEVGFFSFLTPVQFKAFLEGELDKDDNLRKELKEKGFIKDADNLKGGRFVDLYRSRNSSLSQGGPHLHIIVVTLGCNLKCVYCQVSSKPIGKKEYNMDLTTAKQTVDFIFRSPAPSISIEFQGGEPLVNWPVVKFIVEYARRKSNEENRELKVSLVSNLTLMTKDRLDFLIKNMVHVCTSLDGPEKIHNGNRIWIQGNSYKKTIYWLKEIKKKILELKTSYRPFLNALVTISRNSLKYPEEIVDEYLKQWVVAIHLRPLTYMGFAGSSGDKIGYSAEEFIDFWKKSMDYIILINKKGKFFYEREAQIMLRRILTDKDPSYTDLCSPCGAAIGQLLYNYDGNIYTCDEGRMTGDDTFVIGNARQNYKDIISNNKVKTMVTASCLDNLSCDHCVYKPYCGVCPVRNYVYYGNLFPQIRNTDWCKIKTAQFDYLFEKMRDSEVKEIFKGWVSKQYV